MEERSARLFIISMLSLLFTFEAFSQAGNFPVKNGVEFSPRLLDNLIFLNNFDRELPLEKQLLYKWAETRLSGEAGKGFSALVDYPQFQKLAGEFNIVHLGGPMLGNITTNSVDIWVRTVKPDLVTVKVEIDGEAKEFGPVKSTKNTELTAIVHVSDLKPDTRYTYKVFVGEQEIGVPENACIWTPSGAEDVNTRIIFGGDFHRWGLGNEKQSKAMIERHPHAFLGLGDIGAQDRNNHAGWHSLDYMARDLYPAWQNLVSNVPVYATWDDHDYFGNDKAGIPEGYREKDKENVWKVFRYSWNNPSYGLGEHRKGIFLRTRIGHCDVIMTDNRYFRTGKKGSFLGDAQMDWLKKQLLDCKGPFIILSCGSMWSDYVSGGKDSWGINDPEGREELFDFIEDNNIRGVLLISGDRHGARGFQIPRPSGFKFYEFGVGSLGGLSGPPATMSEWTTQFYGISGGYAFGEFEINTKVPDPTVTFRLIDQEGENIEELTLKRSKLTPGNFNRGNKEENK
ncbi:alkaline phosphatase D family protein [Parapedobacter tibetensis]|uniref:alkaline phosphatase D family protein n=1 Tax=Parapedobacter tibetensis TaxID=2972951 RepID=UPI00214D7C66|nr:alkaline phosphatase D family protein [Parapedobacter tibetensis]